jgi:hypothetical protein
LTTGGVTRERLPDAVIALIMSARTYTVILPVLPRPISFFHHTNYEPEDALQRNALAVVRR